MKFISTNKKAVPVSFMEAMRRGLAPDGGLYMPDVLPVLPQEFWSSLQERNFHEIALEMAKPFLEDEISEQALQHVIEEAFNFPVELREIEENLFVLELFHGPTLAFKDFGARFMARIFAQQAQKSEQEVTILAATSGDTGSAVANGFYKVEGVRVCLLYPKGKISPLQEKQMTTLGQNITALEIDGVFDDCQRLVKQAFTDGELSQKLQLSSANSINIARLLPQSFYYAFAVGELQKSGKRSPVLSVPSGNFGNLTGGIIANKMGLSVRHMLAATNANNIVPDYLEGKKFNPKNSVHTISNAMDVGNPSNFARMKHLFNGSDKKLRSAVTGFFFSDDETRETIRLVYNRTGYVLDPHTAIGYRAAQNFRTINSSKTSFIVPGTAHPVKFRDVIEGEINKKIALTGPLKETLIKEKKATALGNTYKEFKELLLNL
ncbi:MAG: threonine synthase [Balneolaceae bacterium]